MSKQKLALGSDVDLLSGQEYSEATDRVIRAIVGLRQAPIIIRQTFPVTVDQNGNVGGGAGGPGVSVFEVPTGMRCDIQRVTLSSPAYPPNAPLQQGYLYGCPDAATSPPVYIWPGAGTTVMPAIYTDGDGAVVLNGGQRLIIVGAGLSDASFEFTVGLQIRQWYDYPREARERRF